MRPRALPWALSDQDCHTLVGLEASSSTGIWGPALETALAETPFIWTEAPAGPLYLLEQTLGFSQTQLAKFFSSLYILK